MEQGVSVLLVEDDVDDAFLFQRAVNRGGFSHRINVACNGLQAIAYMEGQGEFADRDKFPFPKFIITDNRMPLVSGKEFLLWLKNHPQFHVVPTIMLGGNEGQSDVDEAYEELGIHSFIVKPAQPSELEKIVGLIFDYWEICRVPRCKIKDDH
jgi:CheY-like chemotaxis protein